MHKILINKQADRILAFLILLLIIVTGFTLLKQFYIDELISMDREVELLKLKNVKIDNILANEKQINEKVGKQKNIIKKDRLFLSSNNSARAASELQNFLKKLIRTHSKAVILTMKPYPVAKHDNYSEVSLEIRIKDISHKEMQNVMYKIENNSPVLLIKELDIKHTQARYKAVVKQTGRLDKLESNLVVSGFFKDQKRLNQ